MKNMKLKKILPLVGVAGAVVTTPILATSCSLPTDDPELDDAITPGGDINTDGDTNTGTNPENPDNGNGGKPDVDKTILDLSKYSNEIQTIIVEESNKFSSYTDVFDNISNSNSLASKIFDRLNAIVFANFENKNNENVFLDVVVKDTGKKDLNNKLQVNVEVVLNIEKINFSNLDIFENDTNFNYEAETGRLISRNAIATNIIVEDASVIQKVVSNSHVERIYTIIQTVVEHSPKTSDLTTLSSRIKTQLTSVVFSNDDSYISDVKLEKNIDENNVLATIEFKNNIIVSDLSTDSNFQVDVTNKNIIKTKNNIELGKLYRELITFQNLQNYLNEATTIIENIDINQTSKEQLIQKLKDALLSEKIGESNVIIDVQLEEVISQRTEQSTNITNTDVKLVLKINHDVFEVDQANVNAGGFEIVSSTSQDITIKSKDVIVIGKKAVQTIKSVDVENIFYDKLSKYLSEQSPSFYPVNFGHHITAFLNENISFNGKNNVVEKVVVEDVVTPNEGLSKTITTENNGIPTYTKPELKTINIEIFFDDEQVKLDNFESTTNFKKTANNTIKSINGFKIGETYKPTIELNDLYHYESIIKDEIEMADPNQWSETIELSLREKLNKQAINHTTNLIKNVDITVFNDENQSITGWEAKTAKVSLEFNDETDDVKYNFDKNSNSNFKKVEGQKNKVDYGIILKIGSKRPTILTTREVEGNFYDTLQSYLDVQDPNVFDSKMASNVKYFFDSNYSLEGKKIVKNVKIEVVEKARENMMDIIKSEQTDGPVVDEVMPVYINFEVEFNTDLVKIDITESDEKIFDYTDNGIFKTKTPLKVGKDFKPTVTLYDLNSYTETVKDIIKNANSKLSVQFIEDQIKDELNDIKVSHVKNLVKDVEIIFADENTNFGYDGKNVYVVIELCDATNDFKIDLDNKGIGSNFKKVNGETQKVVFGIVLNYGKQPTNNNL